ncbi:MAG: Mut7-C RNAse domain-containing protein [Candidatus Bathyarchaeota archaeon]|nr:Mut7-C RNAse domain-containing protein [Candidatus Bathyarchaeota archaeon]
MKFIADGMLGKLTRWLRMLGHNVKYSNKLDDTQLMAIAKKERRILLTRDLELYQQATAKGVKAFYVDGQTEAENLAKIAQKFGISLDVCMAKSRCPKCNAQVKPAPKEKVAGKVEESTYAHYNDFWECPKCGQIYWQGAHWARIRKTLETAKKLSKTEKS